ncbi:DUF5723 family protein [Flavobacteriales bacterium]|nr:DUF5723 family protein [Flavobacteriales bacterium]
MKKLSNLILFSFCFVITSNAQENLGIRNDNFNPVNSQFLNPSSIVDAKPWLDINIIGASAYLRNNFAFYPNSNLLKFDQYNEDPNYKLNLDKIKAFGDFEITGPSASIALGRHSVSVFSNVRGVVNAKNIPGILGKLTGNEGLTLADTGTYDINNARIKSMIWGEIGITYGKILIANNDNMLTGAISVKRLFGFQNASILIDDALVRVPTLDNQTLVQTNGKYSYTEPGLNSGKGWGTSIGLTYKKMKDDVTSYIPHSTLSGCEQINYKYKIGVSLLDIGYINFNNNSYFGDFDETTSVDDINSLSDIQSESQSNQSGLKYKAWLPAAASIQVDYSLTDRVYVNGTIIQNIPTANTYGVERTNALAFSSRYESKYFGIGLPFSLNNYVNPQMGFAIRIANLTIGSDNFLPIFFKHDEIKAGDIYFSLKHTFYKNPKCKKSSGANKKHRRIRSKSRRSKRNSLDCPGF